MKIRSIYLVDISNIVREVNDGVMKFSVEYGIESVKDLTNLFISRMLLKMVSVYKEVHDSFIVFYIERDHEEAMRAAKGFINYTRFFTALKKIKFPLISSTFAYSIFADSLRGNSPYYDEIVSTHLSFALMLPKLTAYVKKMKFYKIDKELLGDFEELIRCITSL